MASRILAAATGSLVLSSCFQTPFDTKATIRLPDGAGEAAILSSATEPGGRTSGFFDSAANFPQSLVASSGEIAGTQALFPPGALAVSADILVEPAGDLATSSALIDLGLGSLNSITAAGVAAIIRPSTDIPLLAPMSLSLPLPESNFASLQLMSSKWLGLGDANERIAILAKVWDTEGGQLRTLLIPASEIEITPNAARFETLYFGAFQAVIMETPVTAKIEAPSSEPVTNANGVTVVKSDGIVPQDAVAATETLRPLSFSSFNTGYSPALRIATATGTLSESAETASCTFSVRRKDRGNVVWSISNSGGSPSASQALSSTIDSTISGPLEASMRCVSKDGRSAQSTWQYLALVCEPGRHGASCLSCAPGTAWNSDTPACEDAGKGFYATGDGVRRTCDAKPANASFTSDTSTAPACPWTCDANFHGPSCVACAAGTYFDVARGSCADAESGFYATGDGVRRTCAAKPQNSSFTGTKSTSADCPYTCDTGFHGTQCVACAAGTAWNSDTSTCEDAGKGFYATGDGVRRTCDAKPANASFTSDTSTAPACPWTCDANFHGPSCVACAAGTYFDVARGSCADAESGFYATGDGVRRTCAAKPQHASFTGTKATSADCPYTCDTGFHGTQCVACAAGTAWNSDTSACEDAGIGFYATGNGIRLACSNKPSDSTYTSVTATNPDCPWTCNPERFGASCVQCQAGFWWNPGETSCQEVGIGYYSTGTGDRFVCPGKPENSDYSSVTADSADCPFSCNSGFWGSTCIACQAGSYWENGTGCMTTPAGYFSTGDGIKQDCSNKPANASYTGTGATGSDCPWTCDAGFTVTGSSCVLAPIVVPNDEIKVISTSPIAMKLAFTTVTDPGGAGVTYDVYRSTENPARGSFMTLESVQSGVKLSTFSGPASISEYVFLHSGTPIPQGVYYFNVVVTGSNGAKGVYKPVATWIGANVVWLFNGNNYDLSGNNNHFVTKNLTSTPVRSPSALDRFSTSGRAHTFNGTSEWGESTLNIGISGAMARTLAYWVKPSLGTYSEISAIASWGSATTCGVFGIFAQGNSYTLWRWGQGCDSPLNITLTGSAQWEHHAITFDGVNLRFYKNGASSSQPAITGTNTSDGRLTLATGPAANGAADNARYFAGAIDDVYLMPAALSAAQVSALYNVTKP